ncbi:hypothetical protein H3S88_13185, partial [Gilliamella sp. B14448G11]|uniref:DUF6708 domain-containing protein n=1 Tax=unclassified Gilliamella TaxID=2685620 RepID=UPI0018DE0800
MNILIVGMVMFIFGFDHELALIGIIGFITCSFGLYLIIPEFYQNAFSRLGNPIIFNRKTGKVYVNESYFF